MQSKIYNFVLKNTIYLNRLFNLLSISDTIKYIEKPAKIKLNLN